MLAPQGRLFGTNGVRFIPGVTGDMSFALKLAESIRTYFSEGEILVGRDGRLTGQMMFYSVTAGLMSSGRNIHAESRHHPHARATVRDEGAGLQGLGRRSHGVSQPVAIQRRQGDGHRRRRGLKA